MGKIYTMGKIYKTTGQKLRHTVSVMGMALFLIGLAFSTMAQESDRFSNTSQQKSCRIDKDGGAVDFTIIGRMPAQARVCATSLERNDADGAPMLAAYDITLTDADGKEWQPAYGQPAEVTITDPSFGNGRSLDIYHETDEGREYVTTVISVNNSVTFLAKHFSVYVVGTARSNRLVVMFYRAYNPYADPNSPDYESPLTPEHQNYYVPDTICMLVKRADTIGNGELLKTLIYAPGPGYLCPGVRFFGWSCRPDYSADLTNRMTINDVRDSVYHRLLDTENTFNDLDTLKFFPIRLRNHNVCYRSFRNPRIVVGIDDILYPADSSSIRPYIVNENYVPEDVNAHFNGWKLVIGDTNVTYGNKGPGLYYSGDSLNIKGDLTFMVDLSYGFWLSFNENGKGASYTAPKFLKTDQVSQQLGDNLADNIPEDPKRFGYTFDGWYADTNLTQTFVFDGYLYQDTIIYAKWLPNESANYTVMVWRQNLSRTGYDLALSLSDSGSVGQNITQAANITTGTIGNLTYVNVLGRQLGGIVSVPHDSLTDPFTGFTLSTTNPIRDTVITPEGQSVIDIYFDRMHYTLKLYMTRTNLAGTDSIMGAGTGNNKRLDIDTNDAGGKYFGFWTAGLDYITRIKGETTANYVVNGNNRYYYHTISAYYGENISDQWLAYDEIQSSTSFVSWILMPTSKAWVGPNNGGNTLKGDVSIMDEQLLGNLADSMGNLITARYGPYEDWYYHLYLADDQGNYPSEPSIIMYARSAGSLQNNRQKIPTVEGYIYNDRTETPGNNIIRHYYIPAKYSIIFMDGNYVNGNEQSIQNKKRNELHAVPNIPYGSDISSYATYIPDLPTGEYGFVFEGWFADEACTQRYEFTTMPLGGVRIYAKWRQIQYRVFLHPQAGRDQSLNWGNSSQAMSFRISYGDKVSLPNTALRDLYTFGGWYTDPECTVVFFPEANPLNENRVTADYDKTVDMTDAIDKWGDIQNPVNDPRSPDGQPYNSDAIGFNGGDRFWITKKLDLYAQWRYKFDGAEGAIVEYVCDGCVPSTLPKDTNLYLDKSKMVSMPGPTPSSYDSIFTYWVIQRWSTEEGKYLDDTITYPGGPFILDLTAARRRQITPDSATYIFRLRANLEPATAQRTFIVWYRNIEDDPFGRSDTVRFDSPDTLFLNMEVSIPHPGLIGSREGYVFKGWYRKDYLSQTGKEDINPEILIGNDTTNVNFLWYNPDNDQFYSSSTFDPENLALGVAADKQQPYHFLYAVWKPITYTVRFNPNTDELSEDGCDKMDYQDFTYDEEKKLLPNCFVWPCHKFLGWTFTSDGTGDTLNDQQLVKNLSLIDKDTVDLYAVWATVTPTLTVTPDSATCVNPGTLSITVNDGTPSYHYMVYGLDVTQTPAVETANPVWEATLDNEVTVPNLAPGSYRVKVVTATGCPLEKDTTIFVKPEEITFRDNSMTFCGFSTFSIVPSDNPNVLYLWSDPIISPSDANVTVTPMANSTTPMSSISGTLQNNSSDEVTVTYEVYPVLGNCLPGALSLPITVGEVSPNYEISLSGPAESVCAGNDVTVTATVNNAIYNNPYTLHWVVNGVTTDRMLPAQQDTAKTTVTIPADLCEGSYTVEVFYEDSENRCQVNASTSINVVVKEWTMPADGESTITCVTDTLPPHLLNPSVMPNVTDGCGNTLSPMFTGRTKNLGLHNCSGTVTYTYQYSDCTGETKYWRYVYTIQPEDPVLTINGTATSIPIGNCRHRIPAIDYTVEGCGNIIVTQDPVIGYEVSQSDVSQYITVTLTATDACGNTDVEETVVTIPAKPTITVEATPTTVCPGTPVALNANVTGTDETPVWTSNPSTGVFSDNTFTSDIAGNYTLTVSVGDMASSCFASASTVVTVNPEVTLSATDTTQTVCKGEPIRLIHVDYTAATVSVSGLPAGVDFNNDPIDPNINGTPAEAGTFHYIITATSNKTPSCGVKTLTGTITVTETGGEIAISSDSLCEGHTATLVVSSTVGSTYAWEKDGVELEATTRTLTVSEAGTYTVTVTSPHGMCVSTGSKTLIQHETERDTLRKSICEVSLPYIWDHVTFVSAGSHSDTLSSIIGCDSIVTRVLTVNPQPVVQIGLLRGCQGTSGPLPAWLKINGGNVSTNSVTGYTFLWQNGSTQPSLYFESLQPSDDHEYTLTVTETATGCQGSAIEEQAVVVYPNPVIVVDTTRESCSGNNGTVKVTSVTGGTSPYTYKWTDGTNTVSSAALAEHLAAGRYYVTVTDNNGCTVTADTIVTLYNPLAMEPITGPTVCAQYEFNIIPVNGTNGVIPNGTLYSWSAPSSTVYPNVSGLASGDHQSSISGTLTNNGTVPVTVVYTVTPSNGKCVGNDAGVSITVTPATINPLVTIAMKNDTTLCSNAPAFDLVATFNNGYSDYTVVWKKDEATVATRTKTASQQTDTINIDLDDEHCDTIYTYHISYTDESGCTANDQCVVTVNSGTWSIAAPDGAATVACLTDAVAPAYPTNVKDGCDNPISGELVEGYPVSNMSSNGCTGTVTYKYRYTACDDTYNDWTYVYTVKDTVKPVINITSTTPPAFCNPTSITPPTFSGTDNCAGDITADIVVTTNGEEGTDCEKSQTWKANYTDPCGNAAVEKTVTYTWTTPPTPIINTELTSRNLGCNPTIVAPTVDDFTVTDQCASGTPVVSLTRSDTAKNGCDRTLMWTASYTNACGTTVSKSITYSWKVMTTPSISTTLPLTGTKECNWDYNTNAPTYADFTVTDGCNRSATATVTPDTLDESADCQRSMTWTATYKNACDMDATAQVITYTWPYDVTKPVITAFDTVATPKLNCEYEMPDLSAATLRRTTDGCSTPTFVSQSINAGEIYPQSDAQQTIEVVVTVKDNCENTQTATVNVIIPAKLSVTAEANPTPICLGSSSSLTATPASATGTPTYTWTPGATLDAANVATVTATPTAAGTSSYTVTVRDENGCENTANVSVTVNDTVKLSAENLTQNVCLDNAITTINITAENATLTQTGLDGTGMTLSGNTITGTPTAVGTYPYTIIATSNKNPACDAKRITGTITVKDLSVSANANNATCANNDGSATVNVSDGFGSYTYSYAYKYPSATHNTEVNLSTKTTAVPTGLDTAVYVVTVTDANGCSKTAEFTVGLINNLNIDIPGEDQHICSGGSFVITPSVTPAGAAVTYSWDYPLQSVENGVSNTARGNDQSTIHGENLVNNTTSTVVLTYSVQPKYGICLGVTTPVTVAVDVTTHPVPTITVRDTTVCWNVGSVGLKATFANVTASVDTVSWKFVGTTTDSVAHLNAVSATDLVDEYTTPAIPTTPCNNTYPYVVYYSDEYGCKSQRSANVIVSLPTTITITGGTNNHKTIECVNDTIAPHLISPSVMPTVKDACDNDISNEWTLQRPTNAVDCEGTLEYVYTYKNCANNTATWTYTYNITRTTAPHQEGSVASTKIVECLAAATPPTTLPLVKDVCGKTLDAPSTPAPVDVITECKGTRTYTYVYEDCAGKKFTWNFVYTINPTTPPTVNATGIEASKTVDCIDKATAPATIPTATSHCEESLTGTLTSTVDAITNCAGTRTYTYTYTDCSGLTATWDYVYTITPKTFDNPTDVTKDVACIDQVVAPHTLTGVMPTVTDNCGNTLSPETPLPTTYTVGTYNGCAGTVTYTYNYRDCAGNTQDWVYTYNIATPTAPALTGTWPSDQMDVNGCYADRPAFPTKAAVKALYTASCGKTLTVDSVETVVDNDNCDWEIKCEYTITDGCTPVTHTITYKGGDKTKPVIGTGYTTTLGAEVSSCTYTYPDFTTNVKGFSTDNCTAQADLTVTQNPAAGSTITQTTSAQTLPVKVYVADACGNNDYVTVTVTVPASIALTIDTSASDCYNTADGFLNYTITGGVADYTLALTGPTAGSATQAIAGSYSFTGLADGTYSLKVTDANGCEATATTTIQQINTTLSIKANSHSWTYDGSAHSDDGFTVTFGSESHTGTSGNDVTLNNGDIITDVTVSGSITNVIESPVANALGTGIKVMRGTRDVTCFYKIDTTFGKLTITNSGELALNCVDQSKTFDGTSLSYTAEPTVTTGTTVYYSTDGGITWSTTVPSITYVSESPLTVLVKAENNNYTTATCSYKLTINPAPLTIKLDTTKVYDGTVFVSPYAAIGAGYTVTGLVSGDAVTAGTVTSSDIHKGDYVYNATATITTPFATTKGIDNYNVTYDLKQHIVCRDVVLTSATASRKYNGTNLSDNTVTVSGSGWLSGKAATYDNFASIKDKGSIKNAFIYTLASGEVATDYCVTIDTGMLTVTCREITITAASLTNIPYDGNVHSSSAFTVTGDGMVSGESVNPVIEGSIQFPSQSPVTNAITSYTFTPASTTDNYCVATENGQLTMECVSKTIVITADDGEWTYNGATHTKKSYTLTIDGGAPITVPASADGNYIFPNGDSLHVTISGEVKNVTTGVSNVVAGWTLYHGDENMLSSDNGCYTITKNDGTLKVNCRKITLTSGTASKTYNGSELKEETVTIGGDGMVSGETLNYSNFASITNVGSISNTFNYNFVSPALASNYCVNIINGNLEVTCKEVTITANSNNKTYDGTPLTDDGFTATPLETGDTHTFTVAMTSGSTITNVGTQTNVIATVDGMPVMTGVETLVGNYCVTTATGNLTVTPAALLIKLDTAKVYDATPFVSDYMATTDGYTIIGLVPNDYITAGVVTSSAADVNTYIDSVASASADVTTPFATHNGIGNYIVTYDLRQVINKKRLIITGEFTKVYDGEEFKVYYNQLTYIGLENGDAFTSGTVTTDGYRVGDYYCRDNRFLRTMDELRAYNSDFGPASVTANYTPEFHVVLHIIVRPIEFTAKSGEKAYDGTPLQITDLPAPGYDITSGSIAATDNLAHIDVSGSQLCVGSSASEVANAVIMHGTGSDAENVTDCYSIRYVDGTLRVTDVTTPLICPADLTITLWYGRCDTMLTLPEMATVTPPVDNTTIVNDLARQNPLPVGTHYITWKLLDNCGHVMKTCTQTVTVQRLPCNYVRDFDGNVYPAAYIGCDCWTLVNHVSEHYSDGTPIAQYTRYSDSDSLENIYGKLYSWYSAARVPEGDDTAMPVDSLCPTGTYVQGICPAGWALPTVEDYMNMYVASGGVAGLVKSPSTLVWLPGKQGIAPNLFNAYGAGYYDGSLDRYFNLLGETHFWAVDYSTGSSMAKNFVLNYYCDTGLFQDANKGLGYSIRCVKRNYFISE